MIGCFWMAVVMISMPAFTSAQSNIVKMAYEKVTEDLQLEGHVVNEGYCKYCL